MRIYRVTYYEEGGGSGIAASWYASRRAAEQAAREHRKGSPKAADGDNYMNALSGVTVDALDVPRTRQALCAWLNNYCSTY